MINQKPRIYDAIRELVGGRIAGETDSFESTQYLDGQTPPTKKEAEAKLAELIAEFSAKQYQRDRQYPAIGEQLDLLFHDMTAGKGTKSGNWYKAVNKVKTDNPKPE